MGFFRIPKAPTPKTPTRPWSPLDSSYRFMQGKSGTIPSETSTGQTGMLPSTYGLPPGAGPGVIGRGVGGRVSTPPPFKSKGYGTGDPRAKVMGAARNAELAEKRKVKKQRMPKPGQAIPYTPPKRYGPNTKSEQYVDDLFGV